MPDDRTYRRDEAVGALRDASAWNIDMCRRIAADQWDRAGLGEWTTLELVAHTSRAYTTIVDYLQPHGDVDLGSAALYFRVGVQMADAAVHAQVAERGRNEAKALCPDPLVTVTERAAAALNAVEHAGAAAVATTPIGTLALADYVATRVVELTVHTIDIVGAIGLAGAEPPASSAQMTLQVLADLAVASPAGLIRAITGRAPLPEGFSVFG
jgi:hypothetical protein